MLNTIPATGDLVVYKTDKINTLIGLPFECGDR